jgi:hypothetical protein
VKKLIFHGSGFFCLLRCNRVRIGELVDERGVGCCDATAPGLAALPSPATPAGVRSPPWGGNVVLFMVRFDGFVVIRRDLVLNRGGGVSLNGAIGS